MGQVSRISISALLITSLGCGRLPEQVQRNTSAAAPVVMMTLPSLALPTAGPWMVDEHGENVSFMQAEPDLVGESELPTEEGDQARDGASDEASTPRLLKLYALNERTLLEVSIDAEGRVAEADRAQIEYFFRCRRTEQTHAMAEGVLKILYAIDKKYPGHVIEIVSGYRTFPYGVRDSKHYEGHAIDLRVRGIRTSRVRDFVWTHFADVGVGHYEHQNFVHVDYRPEDKDTAWTSVAPDSEYAYNPRWALRLRAPWRAPRAL